MCNINSPIKQEIIIEEQMFPIILSVISKKYYYTKEQLESLKISINKYVLLYEKNNLNPQKVMI